MTSGLHGDFELLFLTRILVNDLRLKEKRMINTYVSARECRAPCTHTCTRRSKKPCLLINEIFLGQTLMIHLSQWSMRTAGDGSGGIQSRAEARGSLKATNLSYVVHAASQTQHHSGVRNKQNGKKKAI